MSEPRTTFVATCSLTGQVQGRSYVGTHADGRLRDVGWVPADLAIGMFGHLADGNVFGSGGDLRLRPDPDAVFPLAIAGGKAPLDVALADQVLPDGTEWPACPRTFLRYALADLETLTGARVVAAFEHEFVLTSLEETAPFSLQRHRAAEPFGTLLLDALETAGLRPETWLPEYGDRQFEITMEPAGALVAADRAIVLREIVREVAQATGHRATFAPILDPDGGGSGVHVHLSLVDGEGRPLLHASDGPGRLSPLGMRLAAGIIHSARALVALTAPAPSSFLRLRPHAWSSAGAFLAERNREAMLRICPTSGADDEAIARQLHLEFRAADATANPWILLGALIRAGLDGLRDEAIASPAVWPESIGDDQLDAMPPLPRTAQEALDDLVGSTAAAGWFDPDLWSTYVTVRRDDLSQVAGLTDLEICQKVADVY